MSRLQELLKEPRMSVNRNGRAIKGNTLVPLYKLIQKYYKSNFDMVELGSFEGASTELFALCCKQVYSIDPYDLIVDPDFKDETKEQLINAEKVFINKIEKYNYKNVTKIKDLSWDAANQFKDKSIDAIYIDGDHRYKSVIKDIKAWYSKVKLGGVISGHDFHGEIKKAILEIIGKPDERFKDSSWVYIKTKEEIK